MPSLMVDFIISLDGYAAADGWPGYWGLEGPEYLGLDSGASRTRARGPHGGYDVPARTAGFAAENEPGLSGLTALPKVVFSSTLGDTAVVGQLGAGRP